MYKWSLRPPLGEADCGTTSQSETMKSGFFQWLWKAVMQLSMMPRKLMVEMLLLLMLLLLEVVVLDVRGRAHQTRTLRVTRANVSSKVARDVGTIRTVRAGVGFLPSVCPHVAPEEGGMVRPSEISPTNGASGHARPRRGCDHAHQPCPRCHQPLQQQEGSQSLLWTL